MKRVVLLIVIGILLFSLSTSVYSNQDFNFSDRPITKGIYEETAYTLTRGEWKVGTLSIPFYPSQWRHTYVKYGLSDNLQVGSTIPQNVLGRPNVSTKYGLPFGGPLNSSLAVPMGLDLQFSPLGISTSAGLVASWNVNQILNFHAGTKLWLTSYSSSLLNSSVYAITDYNLLPNVKAIGEVDFHTFGEDFLSIRTGALWRALEFINLKASSTFEVPTGGFNMSVRLFLRF